jgi:glycosyltransferase domain-containing protein
LKYLIRSLEYWSDSNCSLIVLDGSKDSSESLIQRQFPNIKYFHLPVPLEQRLFFVGSQILTKYVMVAADDDFILKSGVKSCMNFLELNSDYVAAFGTAARIKFVNGEVRLMHDYPNLIRVGQVNNESHWKRLRYHFRNDNFEPSTFYSIQSSSAFKKVSRMLQNMPELDGNMLELLIESAITYSGKTVVLDKLIWIRTLDAAPNWTTHDVVGKWSLKIRNTTRSNFLKLIDLNVLSKSSKLPSKLRRLLYMIILIDKHLYDLSKIKSHIKWSFLPVLFAYSNTNLNQMQFLPKLKKIVSFKKLDRISSQIQLDEENYKIILVGTEKSELLQIESLIRKNL